MKFLKSKFASYCFGMFVGILSTMIIFNISFEASISSTYDSYQKSVTKEIATKEFLDDNKDYVVAGLVLNEDLHPKIVEDFGGKEKFSNYYERDIVPIYRSKIKGVFDNDFKMTNILSGLKTKITALITSNISKIKMLILDKKDVLIKIINSKKDVLIKIINSKKDVLIKIINSKKELLINAITDFINNYLPNISNKVKEKIINFINENKENLLNALKNLPNKIKEKIITYLKENKQQIINQIIKFINDHKSDIISVVIDILKDTNLYDKITSLFKNTDDDYNFSTIEINGKTIDLSFLNIIDIEIKDPVYDNNSTILNPKDDTLKISKIYINFESLNSKGLDIMTGHIDINGIKAKLIYSMIEDFNAFI